MLRRSRVCGMRMPCMRRPRERAWEVFNVRDFGGHEGTQNMRIGFAAAGVLLLLIGFEFYQQWQRILQRGDTCPACEAARAHYRQRVAAKQREMTAVVQADKLPSQHASPQQQQQQQARAT